MALGQVKRGAGGPSLGRATKRCALGRSNQPRANSKPRLRVMLLHSGQLKVAPRIFLLEVSELSGVLVSPMLQNRPLRPLSCRPTICAWLMLQANALNRTHA